MRFRALVTAVLMLLGLIAAAQPANAADPALTVTPTSVSVELGGATATIDVSSSSALPDGATPTLAFSRTGVASVTVAPASAGKSVLTVSGQQTGATMVTISLAGYTSVTTSIMVSTDLTMCSDASPSTPCMRSVEAGADLDSLAPVTGVTAVDYGVNLQIQGGASDVGHLFKVVIDMGPDTAETDYFVNSAGQMQDLDMVTEGTHRLVTVLTKAVQSSWVFNTGVSGGICWVGNCAENLVADDDPVTDNIVVTRVGTGNVPEAFAGGWVSSNAQSLSLASFTGQFSFTVAAPHFRTTCPKGANNIATDPAACADKINTGFYDIFIPADALSTVFNLPGLTAAQFLERMQVNDATNGGTAVNLAESAPELITAVDREGGLHIRITGITYSWHDIAIKPAPAAVTTPPVTENSGGSSGGGGGSSAPAPVEAPAPVVAPAAATVVAETPSAPQPPAAAPRNPVVTLVTAPGVVVISAAEAASIRDRVMRNPAGATLAFAPRVVAKAGRPLALVVPGQVPGATVSVRIKVGGKYLDLGKVTVDASGRTALPVLKLSRPGVYTIAIVDPTTGKTSYLKVQNTAARTTARA